MFQAQRPKLSPLRRIIVTVPILIGLLISLLIGTTQSAAFASSETATSKEIITGLFPIRARMEKDHRIRVNEEKLHQEPRVHVYLVLSDQKLPYTVSLGWLKVIKAPDSLGKEEEKKSLFGKTLSVSNPFKKHEDLLNPSKKDAKSLAVIDENGFIVPSPGFQTGQKDFRKVDYRGLIAFEYLMDGNLTKARKEYGQTVKDGPADPKFHNNLGALLALNGDYKQASEQFDQSLKSKSDYG
ncbi:MAG: hypothetical protein K8F91_07165, partial [Candidatus Obscuribacterales bacterium]|nr:hypothetical protein [Candidatus Obscuribacterales bacterium]